MAIRFTGVSFIKALDLPLSLISLLITVGVSKSNSCCSKKYLNFVSLIIKLPSTTHFFVLSFNTETSALCPKMSDNAPKRIDFPAPVSPVITVKSLLKSS